MIRKTVVETFEVLYTEINMKPFYASTHQLINLVYGYTKMVNCIYINE